MQLVFTYWSLRVRYWKPKWEHSMQLSHIKGRRYTLERLLNYVQLKVIYAVLSCCRMQHHAVTANLFETKKTISTNWMKHIMKLNHFFWLSDKAKPLQAFPMKSRIILWNHTDFIIQHVCVIFSFHSYC